jgi:hypothetical protein
MDRDQETEHAGKRPKDKQPGRSWTERFTGPIRYRRFTDIDAGGRPAILFKFELAPGQSDLPQEVYDILHQLKHLDPHPGHGTKPHFTGLTFNRSKKHGRVWRLPDDPTGRTAADIIDAKLSVLAEKLDREQGMGR